VSCIDTNSAPSAFFVYFRYWPVRHCPVLIWWKRAARRFGTRSTIRFVRLLGMPYFLILPRPPHR